METSNEFFNKKTFMTNMMDDNDLAKAIIESFLDDYPKQIEMLIDAQKSNDFETAERAAHTIKGLAATMGSESITLLALEMEEAAKEEKLDFVGEKIPALASNLNLLGEALKEQIE